MAWGYGSPGLQKTADGYQAGSSTGHNRSRQNRHRHTSGALPALQALQFPLRYWMLPRRNRSGGLRYGWSNSFQEGEVLWRYDQWLYVLRYGSLFLHIHNLERYIAQRLTDHGFGYTPGMLT